MRRGARGALVALGAAVVALSMVTPVGATAQPAPTPAPAQTGAPIAGATADTSLLVGVAPRISAADEAGIARAAESSRVTRLSSTVLEVRVPAGTTATQAARLRARPEVRYVAPNTPIHAATTPNDPDFPGQWGLQSAAPGIGAPTAWERTTGSANVVVGVLDSGIDLTHPDLATNLWSSPGGSVGCPLGSHGPDFIVGGCVPQDAFGHGTHVAGIIGAAGNNGTGVTGVNWRTRLMAIRILDANGNGDTGDAVAGIDFAIRAKQAGVDVRVLNASWSSDPGVPPNPALHDAIQQAGDAGILFVAAAGNDGIDVDALPEYPCSFHLRNEICVAASTNAPADTLAGFSNAGPASVDLAAPGENIISTLPGGAYLPPESGTSMAAPYVTGAAALMLADHDMPVATLKSLLLGDVAPVPALRGLVTTGGRLDLACAVGATVPHWCAWESPAPALTGDLTSAPAIASWMPGRLDVFTRDTSGRLAHTFDVGSFSGWETLGGGLLGAPAAVSWGPGRLDVFVRGTDDQLWHRWYANGWSVWEPLGGVLTSAPAVSSGVGGRLDVVARGIDGQLWHRWFAGAWSPWESLGGAVAGDPAAVSWGPGRVDVFVRGTDGQVWHRWYAGGWSAWEGLGGQAVGGTAASTRGPGVIDVLVRGTDGHLWHKWYDGRWNGYEDLGGSLTTGPGSASWSAGRVDVVGRGPDGQLTHTYWRA